MGSIPGWIGNGNPFQYSCLENSMDRGAQRAPVHRVTKSQTQQSTHKWRGMHTNTHDGLCKDHISLEKHCGGPMLPEKNTFPLPQGKGSNLSRAFLASRFFFDPSLFHKIGMEISTDYNLSSCLKHQRSDLVFPQPERESLTASI